jgi:hypothetical protein
VIGPYECYACGKRTRGIRPAALTAVLIDDDGRRVQVGPDCLHQIKVAGPDGYASRKGAGPRLFFSEANREQFLRATKDRP